MADYRLIGTSPAPKDLRAKVTGRSRYAEDYRAEGMAFAKLLLSPVPRGRVVRFDPSRALAMEGVYAVITQDNFPDPEGSEPVLTNTPHYQGQPIAAVAAVDETTAAEAVAAIEIEVEPLPFAVDPLDALRPGGPNTREEGNVWLEEGVGEARWTAEQVAAFEGDSFPEMEYAQVDTWEIGNIQEGFAAADVIVARPIVHQSNTHHPMEPRSSMAYWQNGKCYMHCSTQSLARTVRGYATRLGIEEQDMVLISEFCGGGFGSKGSGNLIDTVSAQLSREIGRPVQLRVTRDEETYFGRARPGVSGWAKVGMRRDGRITAMDIFVIQDSGPYARPGDYQNVGNIASLAYQPEAMRFRGVAVVTNTPPKGPQRGPGGAQSIIMLTPVLDLAAREAGVDRMDMLYINAPPDRAVFGPAATQLTSAYAKEALLMLRDMFSWDEKKLLSGQRNGSKVTGIGVALSPYSAGSSGMDGLLVIRPDGKLTIHSGVGNLGTASVFDTAMAAAEPLGVPWEDVDVVWGNSSLGVPWSSSQSGSQTTHAHTRANYATGLQARRKLQEIAARDLGGAPETYDVNGGRVFRMGNSSVGMTLAQAAQRAIELGGQYDGHELPDALDEMTRRAVADHLVGQGLVAAAKDEFSHEGATRSTVVAAAVVEVDVETGEVDVKELVAVADVGTVLNPRNLRAQTHAGLLQGMSQARFERWAYDLRWGVNQNRRLHTAKPIPFPNIPETFQFAAVGIPDRETPIGSRGIGEPPVGAGGGVIVSAIGDALGVYFGRTPVTPDKILNALEGGATGYSAVQSHV